MTSSSYGGIDYSDDPILPPWYVPGWTSQNAESTEYSVPAPTTPLIFSSLPPEITWCQVTGSFDDGIGSPLGGYFTFEQSSDLLIQQPSGTYFRVPRRYVGAIPTVNVLAYNFQGSGKVYLQFGLLNVILMTNDQPDLADVTILEPYYKTQQTGYVTPTTWVYHVREYIGIGSMKYDIVVSSASAPGPADINTLIVPDTYEPNREWNRGF